jgi:methylenetetrahydrofolate dehydrogenase (NADP+)/methenyltetrahydrofolate cyclohydrolase
MIVDGKQSADTVLSSLKEEIKHFFLNVGLRIVLVGTNPASEAYVEMKLKRSSEIGIDAQCIRLDASTSTEEILSVLQDLNNQEDVDGIIVQLPLPSHVDSKRILSMIDPKKDVDGLHPYNLGLLLSNQPLIIPCTPKGILYLLKTLPISLEGKNAVIVGRSNIVGKPLAALLLNENCSVTLIHSYSKNWEQHTRNADIVVVAIGVPGFLKKEHIQEGAIVIDVGITRTPSGLVGDCDFEDLKDKVSYITPVPGGVGPMTVASLLWNTVEVAKRKRA